jgi:hypothetical protein
LTINRSPRTRQGKKETEDEVVELEAAPEAAVEAEAEAEDEVFRPVDDEDKSLAIRRREMCITPLRRICVSPSIECYGGRHHRQLLQISRTRGNAKEGVL